ncbi:tetratricopeptide repeat-containing sensor histidine kinase [Pedobacter africanus]|uniref:histidine kinase n=1 Tax=Pedobacter africanus TaxID=151894 RepID=A0A1W1Z1F4_9SPHI|nr:ATP-binding protein [Pedobacter africanus]SMC42224.1 Histidine kinase [Pedobacter africanus]
MRKLLLILLTGLASLVCRAQDDINKDSLLRLLPAAKEDTAKVLLYLDIGNAYEMNDVKTAQKYYLLAGNLSKRLNYKRGTLKFISNYTGILNAKGSFDSSLLLNKQSIQIATALNDVVSIAKTTANTGNSYNFLGQYDKAVYYYEIAKKHFDQINNPYLSARMNDLIQNVYLHLNQYEKGARYGREAVHYFRAAGKEMELGQALLNLANNYQSLKYNDSALVCYKEGITIAKKTGYKALELASLIGIGNIYFHRYDADGMKKYHEAALSLSRQINDAEGEVIAGRGMALHFLLKKNFKTAKNYISASLKLADSLDLNLEKFEGLKVMSSILFGLHDVIAAEKYLDSSSVIENKLRGEEIQNKTLLLEKRFETEKKEAQLKLQQAQLRQKSSLIYFLIAGAIALLVITLLSYRNYRHRRKLQQAKIDELETEKQLTATEAVLKGEEQERTRLAKDLHDGLGGMLSGIKFSLGNIKENLVMTPDNTHAFERSIDMLDSSIQEMRRVAHNMMPEMLVKYGLDTALKEFCTEMDRSGVIHINYQSIGMHNGDIAQTTSVTIYRIIQELVNNSIKHAQAKNVLVQLHQSQQENLLAITVEDDGKGFNTNQLKQANGMGWLNIQNRVEFLKGKIDLQSSPGKGTSVMIEINI